MCVTNSLEYGLNSILNYVQMHNNSLIYFGLFFIENMAICLMFRQWNNATYIVSICPGNLTQSVFHLNCYSEWNAGPLCSYKLCPFRIPWFRCFLEIPPFPRRFHIHFYPRPFNPEFPLYSFLLTPHISLSRDMSPLCQLL